MTKALKLSATFKVVMIILIITFFILLFNKPLGHQLTVFFRCTEDLFADFFNPVIYVADNDVYHNTLNGLHHKIYFPLTYMMFSLFSGFADYSGMTLFDAYSSQPAMMSCVFFTMFSVFLFLHALNKVVKVSTSMLVVILCSSVFLFTIERGNPIMIAAALVCYFIAYKDSELKSERYFALTALCVAVVLKGFPVILGFYLLQQKRFKDILYCIVVTTLLVFLPFLYFKGGFDNISQLISNVQLHNRLFEDSIYPRFGLSVFNLIAIQVFHLYDASFSDTGFMITKSLVILLSVLSLGLFFVQRTPWKKLMLLTVIVAYLPSDNGFYCGMYFFPVLLLFLKEQTGTKLDYAYMIMFCILLNPIQISHHNTPITWMLSNLAIFVMWITLITETVKDHLLQPRNEKVSLF